jgi:hypothetical protein
MRQGTSSSDGWPAADIFRIHEALLLELDHCRFLHSNFAFRVSAFEIFSGIDRDLFDVAIAAGLATCYMLTAKQEIVMANEGLIDLVGWCKRERESLQMQREMLRSGKFRIFKVEEGRQVDTSSESIERITENMAELDLILAGYEARGVHG